MTKSRSRIHNPAGRERVKPSRNASSRRRTGAHPHNTLVAEQPRSKPAARRPDTALVVSHYVPLALTPLVLERLPPRCRLNSYLEDLSPRRTYMTALLYLLFPNVSLQRSPSTVCAGESSENAAQGGTNKPPQEVELLSCPGT